MPIRSSNTARAAAMSLSGSVLGGLLLGALAGVYWDFNPAAALIGLAVGVVAGFYNLAKSMWTKE